MTCRYGTDVGGSAAVTAAAGVRGFPAALTSFVGRGTEVAEVAELLGEYRLVTVTGPGGMGKTRLAGEVARRVADRFADGVWLVELARVQDPALTQAAVSVALGAGQAPGVSALDSLAAAVGRQQLLLVLDNCEHVLAAVAELCAALLPVADDIRILATSREPVGVAGEVRFRLGALGLPGPDGRAAGSASEAAALFADRARRVDPHFRLSAESGPVVERLVARLDGMPLAIELAAARVEALGLTQLADRLDDRFALLVGTDRLAAPRQRSLAATAQWSHELLTEAERQVFRRLSVFPAAFTLDAAEAVAGAGAGNVVLRLVDCSLLSPPSPGVDARARYLMLETLRAYGADRLAEAGEQAQTAAALAGYALRVAEQAAAVIETPAGELAAARWLDAEDATVHTALAWALAHDPPAALRLALALAPWWRQRGRYADGYALLEAAAAHCSPTGQQRGAVQVWLGLLSLRADDTVGLGHFTAARDALAPHGPSPMLVQAVNGRASTLRNTGHAAESAEEAHRALAMARDLGDAYGESAALYHLTALADYAGDQQAELGWLRQAQQIDPARVPPVIARRHAINLADCLMEMGDLGSARQACLDVLASAQEAGAAALQAECLTTMVDLELRAGHAAEATARLAEALGLATRAGTLVLLDCLEVGAHLCAQTQRWAQALTLWAAAVACQRNIGMPDIPQEVAHRAGPLGKARQAVGPAAAQAAEDRGAAMTLATAIDFATLLAAEDPGQPSPVPGLPQLSAREQQLVTLVAQGHTDAQIAAQLYISVRTVRSHLDRIRDKTGCRRRADLTRLALTAGLV
jgi:predicted ATPase/DNA-binding CsgD family transcriptional regulator